MASIFISYSRQDKEVVRQLHDTLKAQGHEPWVDWEGILPSADWLQEIYSAIDATDFFLFVMSPDSVASEVCEKEIAHAVASHKALVPIVIRDVKSNTVPKAAAAHNWIFCRETDDFDAALQTLLKALDTDIEWVHAHTRLLTRALDWQKHNYDSSFSLQGHDLQKAEQWLARAADGKKPHPTALHTNFILASRRDVFRRQRLAAGAFLVGVLIMLILGFNAWEHAQRGRVLQARDLFTQALWSLNDNDAAKAEVLLAQSLESDDRRETRDRFLEAHAKTATLEWVNPGSQNEQLLAVSADGSRFAIKDDNQRVELWDTKSRQRLGTLPPINGLLCAAFSHDNHWLATSGSDLLVRLWEFSTDAKGKHVTLRHTLRGHFQTVRCLSFSPDDRLLASAGRGRQVRLWDVAQGRCLRTLLGHREQILCLAFSPDGKTLVSGGWGDDMWQWDVATGRRIRDLHGHEDAIFSVAFSPDGQLLASASWDATIWLWNAQTGQRLRQLSGHKGGVLAVAFSYDGREVLSSGEDGTARIWNTESGRETMTLRGQNKFVPYVALGRTETQLVVGTNKGTVRVWNVATVGQRPEMLTLRGHRGSVRCLAFNPEGSRLITGREDLSVCEWDAGSGKPIRALSGHQRGVYSIFYRPDGKGFASAAKDGTVRVWDSVSGHCLQVLRHPASVRHVEFSPNELLIAVACDNGKIYLWQANSAKLVRVLNAHNGMALCVGFSHDGRLLATGGEDQRVLLWDVRSGRRVALLRGHLGSVWDVAFSGDNQKLFSCGEDEIVRVWDVKTRMESGQLRGHSGPVWDLSWNNERHSLASAGQDGTVLLWQFDATNNLQEAPLVLRACSGPVWWVDFSADGTRLAASSQDHTARMWRLDEVGKLLQERPDELLAQATTETGLQVN